MTRYAVFLEIATDGLCMAHVPELPGCFVRAAMREEALICLPAAIRDHHAWLRSHSEPAPFEEELIDVQIAGESLDIGPFDPGDVADLLAPDRESLSTEAMEGYLRLMAHTRQDLLTVVQDLRGDLLDWQLDSGSFTIRRVLRHVGNSEEWYVSRLVPPETLPVQWKDDEDLPVFEFLEMERATAVERLRQMSEEERSKVFYPARWTNHPEEGWTLRKALRRFLEHEREHTAQISQILGARRQWMLDRLAEERAGLLEQLLGIDEPSLSSVPISEEWTVKDLLVHIAAWNRWEERTMRAMAAGEQPDLAMLQDPHAANTAFVAPWRHRSLAEILAELESARRDWLFWLQGLSNEEFFRPRWVSGRDLSFCNRPVQSHWEHDADHARQIAAWRDAGRPGWDGGGGLKGDAGSGSVQEAALAAAREELLTISALVPAGERASRPVCGEWTLKDVLGHMADWEAVGVEGLRSMAVGRPPAVDPIDDIEAWNQAHVQARGDQPWAQVGADLTSIRQEFVRLLRSMDDDALVRSFPFPWAEQGTAYQWVSVFFHHDREHAEGLRTALFED